MVLGDLSVRIRVEEGPQHPRDLWEIDGDRRKGKLSVRDGITQHRSRINRHLLLWILRIHYKHTHTHRNVHSCITCTHIHRYTWMHTYSFTIHSKQNQTFVHNQIYEENLSKRDQTPFPALGPSLLVRWKPRMPNQSPSAHLPLECWGVIPLKSGSASAEFHSRLGPTFQDKWGRDSTQSAVFYTGGFTCPAYIFCGPEGLLTELGEDLTRLDWMKFLNNVCSLSWRCWGCVSMDPSW